MTNLKSYRRRKKLRQSDLAKELGVEQATISKLEAGAITPGLELAFMIEDCTANAVPARSWLKPKSADCFGADLSKQSATLMSPVSPYPKDQVQRSDENSP